MKSPEQIAREVMKFHRGRPDSQIVANIPSMVAAAIEADRAQRYRVTESDMDDMLGEWENFAGDVSYFYSKWAALLSDDRQEWIEGRIAELSREWEDAVNYGRDEDEPYHHAADYALSEDDWRAGLDDEGASEVVRLIEYQKEQTA